ncbi:MAG TPA: peptidylprolyl isomerase [Nitrospirota bacterium]|nr:peptidylprolyl isomerase [Nitrospirota bacterium]
MVIKLSSKGNKKKLCQFRKEHHMKKVVLSITVSFVLLLMYGLQNRVSGSVIVDRVIAIVNDEIITLSDLQREEALKKSDAKVDEHLLLEDMIDRKLQMAAAKRAGMDVTDKELADAIADIMKRNALDTKQFEVALAKEGLTMEQYRMELREQMTLSRMVGKYVRSGITVDEAEIRAYYDRNLSIFTLPEEIRVRQIYFPLPDGATQTQIAEVKAQAQAVYERANKGEDFINLVRENSRGPDPQDGDLGFMQRQHVLPEIEEATRNLKPGQIAGPLLCAGGFHIIRLEDLRTPVKSFEKVKEEIMNTLYQQKVENTYRTWLQTLRSDSNIENRL